MKSISVTRAAELCEGKLVGYTGEDKSICNIAVDSKSIKAGDLFAALVGEKTDGHNYIQNAFEQGAVCCLAEYIPQGVSGTIILTDSVRDALKKISSAYRQELNIPVIGVVGSVGKTTAKEMIASVLAQKMKVLKTLGNQNNELGVPITMSRIEAEHEAAVVELGISQFGEMSLLSSIAKPQIAVFTSIAHAHLEFLHDLDGVFKAKTELLAYMPKDGIVIYNGDDAMLRRLNCPQLLISYGLGEDCMIRAHDIEYLDSELIRCVISYGDRSLEVKINAYGQHMIYAALEGAAVGFVMGLCDEEIIAGIAEYKPVGRRGVITKTDSITLIEDCYNANPDSMRCAVDSLVMLPGRHICVLSDMLEMGESSPQMHRELGEYALQKGVELLLACGPMSRNTAEAMGERAAYFETKDELIKSLPDYIMKGDNVLVKASLGMHMETAAEALKTLEIL